jgi:hypothetical protein
VRDCTLHCLYVTTVPAVLITNYKCVKYKSVLVTDNMSLMLISKSTFVAKILDYLSMPKLFVLFS